MCFFLFSKNKELKMYTLARIVVFIFSWIVIFYISALILHPIIHIIGIPDIFELIGASIAATIITVALDYSVN